MGAHTLSQTFISGTCEELCVLPGGVTVPILREEHVMGTNPSPYLLPQQLIRQNTHWRLTSTQNIPETEHAAMVHNLIGLKLGRGYSQPQR